MIVSNTFATTRHTINGMQVVNTTVVYHINTHISTPVVFRNTSDHRNTIVKRPFPDSAVPSQATLFGFFNINGTLLCSAD